MSRPRQRVCLQEGLHLDLSARDGLVRHDAQTGERAIRWIPSRFGRGCFRLRQRRHESCHNSAAWLCSRPLLTSLRVAATSGVTPALAETPPGLVLLAAQAIISIAHQARDPRYEPRALVIPTRVHEHHLPDRSDYRRINANLVTELAHRILDAS